MQAGSTDNCPQPMFAPRSYMPLDTVDADSSGLKTPEARPSMGARTRSRSTEKLPEPAAAASNESPSMLLGIGNPCCSHPAPKALPVVDDPTPAAGPEGGRFKAGMLVKLKKNGRGRISKTYTVLHHVGEKWWRLQDMDPEEQTDASSDVIARARGISNSASAQTLAADDQEDVPSGWYKVGMKQWGAYYGRGLAEVKCIPFTKDLVDKLAPALLHKSIVLARFPNAGHHTAGVALRSAGHSVDAELMGNKVVKFKIGITANPFQRWAYYHDELAWEKLILLWTSQDSGEIRMLEAALIKQFQGDCRCANVALSGEGCMLAGPPFYAYMVVGTSTSEGPP